MKAHPLSILLVLVTAFVLSSCGGNGAVSDGLGRAGSADVSLTWPDATRVIPNRSNSIVLRITKTGSTTQSHTFNRTNTVDSGTGPSESHTFTNLDEGEWTATASAFPQADGDGEALATGTSTFRIEGGQSTNFSVTMDSTVLRYKITIGAKTYRVRYKADSTGTEIITGSSGAGSVVTELPLPFASDITILAEPSAADDTLLLVDNNVGIPEVSASIDNSSVATIKSAVTADSGSKTRTTVSLKTLAAGTASLTFTYRESGRTFAVPISVGALTYGAGTLLTATMPILDVSGSSQADGIGVLLDDNTPVGSDEKYHLIDFGPAPSIHGSDEDTANADYTRLSYPFAARPTTQIDDLSGGGWAPKAAIDVRDIATHDFADGSGLTNSLWILQMEEPSGGPLVPTTPIIARINPANGLPSGSPFTTATTLVVTHSLAVGTDPSNPTKAVFYVVDTSGTVRRFHEPTSGTTLVVGSTGFGGDGLAVDVDTDGTLIYVLRSDNKVVISRFDGTQVSTITLAGIGTPKRIAVASQGGGRVILAAGDNSKLQVFLETVPTLP